ncbi:NIL domain-containing protein [Aerosakkonemataceae cyanobacterium BLCC-F50]|uniref:NIL domain-containing protein n=1 Tax=Floridaenema flaviceps BLCC-F50 TaxID=3153642 RepID=A0ABV4XW04_9CYAN
MNKLKHRFSELDSVTKVRIKIKIPQTYQKEPVLSRLTADYGLTFNITKAILGGKHQEGWFDLELLGTPEQLQNALDYLLKLQIKIWGKPNPDGDAW